MALAKIKAKYVQQKPFRAMARTTGYGGFRVQRSIQNSKIELL